MWDGGKRVEGLGCGVGCGVEGLRFLVEFRVQGSVSMISGLGFGVEDLGFRV